MKITKQRLKQIIEEVLLENQPVVRDDKLATSGLANQSTQQRKDMRQGGINDQERAAIAKVSQKLAAAAKSGNILSGTLKTRLEQLMAEIDKALGTSAQSQNTQPTQGAQ